jgi:hypothetical protein
VDAQNQVGATAHVPPHPSPLPRGERGQNGVTQTVEATWPRADAVIGNPPFLGSRKLLRELGTQYVTKLRSVYVGKVPDGADFVMFWFYKCAAAIQTENLTTFGLVATQSIRSGQSATVLAAALQYVAVFDAWSDEPWVVDGAAVRVSIVCACSHKSDNSQRHLNGEEVGGTISERLSLSNSNDAHTLAENRRVAFQGLIPLGPFDVEGNVARRWLRAANPHGISNACVLTPIRNGNELTKLRMEDSWLLSFPDAREKANLFEAPWQHAELTIKPWRVCTKKMEERKSWDVEQEKFWWRHWNGRNQLRSEISALSRYIVTPRVAAHRIFLWLPSTDLPDTRLFAICRSDDSTFGVLHSRFHEAWALHSGSMHGVGNDPTYNAKSCFETFPFPAGLTPRDTAHQRTEVLADGVVIPAGLGLAPSPLAGEGGGEGSVTAQSQVGAASHVPPHPGAERDKFVAALPRGERGQNVATAMSDVRNHAINIARAAKRLNDLRERWLNPPEWTEAVPEVIPLGMTVSPYPDRILPRGNLGADDLAALKKRTLTNLYNLRPAWLADAHTALDAAVAEAYGWADYSAATTDNEILARLLTLNLERAASEKNVVI